MQWFVTLLVLGVVAAGSGGLLGLHILQTAELVADAQKSANTDRPVASHYSGNSRLRKLSPVVTNLGEPTTTWARVEASLVLDNVREEEANLLAARIGEDVIAYLRTVSLPQLEGARGLQYLREDLNERAAVRSAGKVREVIIETLVVQ